MPQSDLPTVTTHEDAVALIRSMTTDPGLLALVEAFDDGFPHIVDHIMGLLSSLPDAEREHSRKVLSAWKSVTADTDPIPDHSADRVSWLLGFAGDRWDFRCGSERDQIPTSVELLPEREAQLVYDIADRWGMRSPRPASGTFDGIIVLGGLIRANLNRPQAAADALASGAVRARFVVGLTGDRAMSPQELQLAEALEVTGTTEQEALAVGLSRSFNCPMEAWQVGSQAGHPVWRQSGPDGLQISLVLAPPRDESGQRASTSSSFEWFAKSSGLVGDSARLLSITTPIYWIQNHIDLLTKLARFGNDATVVTAGGTVDVIPGELTPPYRSQHYLQEIKSAIDALPKLQEWAGI